jgi:hypothetical protein
MGRSPVAVVGVLRKGFRFRLEQKISAAFGGDD